LSPFGNDDYDGVHYYYRGVTKYLNIFAESNFRLIGNGYIDRIIRLLVFKIKIL